ncbi:unnamed protein product, partial [Coregonus sp. 'balchen']
TFPRPPVPIPPTDTEPQIIPIISTFSDVNRLLHSRLKFAFTQRTFPPLQEFRPISAFCRNPNLRDLNFSQMSNKPTPKLPIEQQYYRQLSQIQNPNAQTSSPISQLMTIQSTNIVYAITCTLCHNIYIGETGHTVLTRLKQHLYTIGKNIKHTPGPTFSNPPNNLPPYYRSGDEIHLDQRSEESGRIQASRLTVVPSRQQFVGPNTATARAKTSLPTSGSSPHVLAGTLPSTLASRLTQSSLGRVPRPVPRLEAIKAPTLAPRSVRNKPTSSPDLAWSSRGTVTIPVASTLTKAPDNIPPVPSPTPNRDTLAYPQFTSPPPDPDEFIVDFELREEEFPTLQSIMVKTKHTIAQTKTITVQAQVIHRPCSQLDSRSAPTLTRATETTQPPQTPIISNVAIQSDLNISDLSGSDTNISTLVPTEVQLNKHQTPAEVVTMERGVNVEKVVMMGENKGKINPNSFLSEPSPILTSPHTRYLLPTPLSLSPKNRVPSEPTVRLTPLPSPRHSTPTSPATPPFLYQPTRHDMTNRKIYDWKIKSLKPIAIIGDSNLKRIPYHPYKHIQIDSYPGAQFHHITGVLAKSTPNPNTKVVVLSLGLNNKEQTQKQTPIGQLQSLHSKATVMYPNATIYFPIINYSPHLSEKQQTMLKYINSHITFPRPPVPIPPTDTEPQIIPIISTFSDVNRLLHSRLKFAFTQTQRTFPPLQEFRPLSAFRRNPNLRDLLIFAKFSNKPTPKLPVEQQYHRQLSHIQNPHAQTSSPISQLMTIHSTNIVYAITCTLCHNIYIGETGHTVLTRLKQHLYTIRKNILQTHLVQHFQIHPTTSLHITGLEMKSTWTRGQRKAAESRWISKRNTLAPLGMNIKE